MVLGQIVALVMVNNHFKFYKICFNVYKVITKVKVCHDYDNDDDEETRVMTIPQPFFFKNSRAKKTLRISKTDSNQANEFAAIVL